MQKATKSAYFLKTKMCVHDRHKHRITKVASRTHIHTSTHTHLQRHPHNKARVCANTYVHMSANVRTHEYTCNKEGVCAHTYVYTHVHEIFTFHTHVLHAPNDTHEHAHTFTITTFTTYCISSLYTRTHVHAPEDQGRFHGFCEPPRLFCYLHQREREGGNGGRKRGRGDRGERERGKGGRRE